MVPFLGKYLRWIALLCAGLLSAVLIVLGLPKGELSAITAPGNGVNVILMIGDGMGWEMARTAALAKGTPLYKAGKGRGLSFQKLESYAYATTYGTTVPGADGVYKKDNSALDGSNPETGKSPVRPGFSFKALPFNPGNTPDGGATSGGNLVGYDPNKGGFKPWDPISPTEAVKKGFDKEYIKYSYPDSANTATTLYTGVKSYNNALGVDIFEKDLLTIQQIAVKNGKSTGIVTSVPITHATPGAAQSTVNRRSKYDADYPALDNILQESLRQYQPTVLLGGGHPLDFENKTNVGPVYQYTYIKQSTYEELKAKPTNNRYGYSFLERGPDAAKKLRYTAKSIDPNNGGRLLGLYGARGQNGNLPTSSANGDYSTTGLDNFSVFSTEGKNPDKIRPLSPGETDAQFIATEVAENPKLKDLSLAALDVLSKDKDGFWLMIEGGDIDWAAHDNNIDNLIGTMNDFDKAVQSVISWIEKNGGWRKNLLIVTADHDHYLTLNDNFPELLRQRGAEALTLESNPSLAGHFWGSNPTVKFGWGNHSNRMVPVYYQGKTATIDKYIGKGYVAYGQPVPGVAGAIDQVHIFQAMKNALTTPLKSF
jgi:alkaline phosphatase